jgi:hypothetical protein
MPAVDHAVDRSLVDEAAVRVRAYLACAGLPLEHAELHAKDLVERHFAQREVVGEAVVGSAVTDVVSQYDAWLNWLRDTEVGDGECCTALLAWHLRPVLSANPDVFLQQDDLPEAVHRAVRDARQPVLPEPAPTAMPAQSFGDSARFFRVGFWRGILRRIASAIGGKTRDTSEKGEPVCRNANED